MDTSENMEYLEDSSTMPELSFDDLLDPSPVKKNTKQNDDDDDLELNRPIDDTLNTPGPKKPQIIQRNSTSSIPITGTLKSSTPVRTQPVKLGSSPNIMTNVIKNNSGATTTTTTAPVLLNTKNILPKTTPQISNNSVKLTPKTMANNMATTNLTIASKTAARTSNGQIIYIQKTSSNSNIKATPNSNLTKPQTSSANNPKPMTIQVLRTADGNYVPIKSASAGNNVKNTTLTLSPTSLAGKKIITSSGGQVIIKGSIKTTDSIANTVSSPKTITTNAITSVKTIVKPSTSTSSTNDANKPKPIVVHGTGGKQILVSNQNIVKLSPKPQAITTTAGGQSTSTATTSGTGQLHAIQISGKLGVQYVRVLPNTKIATKTLNPTSTSAPSTTSSVATASKALNTTNQPVKILNSLPQKFTVVQKVGTTKLLVAQKKDTTSANNTGDNNASISKIQKTIVTVPTIKSLNDDKNKHQLQQQPSTKSTQQSLLAGNNNLNQQTLLRKHKISDINTEIKRITTTSDNSGPPEIKKSAPNNRVVVISSNNQPKILNSSIQQPGRITATLSLPSQTKPTTNSSGGSIMQASTVTQNGNKLYTILKPSAQEQKPTPKLYSVLKTNNNQLTTTSTSLSLTATGSTLTAATSCGAGATTVKPLINKQYLIQQQHKLVQQKQQQQTTSSNQSKDSLNAKATTLTKYVLPIKIKEEPVDANLNTNTNSNSIDIVSSAPINMPSGNDDVDAIDPLVGGVRRKHCNCSKSQCLKLYCDCFANGEFCQDCTCKDCFNNLENEDERQRAIKNCLERNPNAFKPKITSSRDQADMRLHNKGCNCKRSGCLKNYCECYEAKIPCSSNCKCVGCRNVEDRPDLDMDPIDPKIMASIAKASGESASMVSQKRTYEKSQRELAGAMPAINIKTEKLSKDNVKSFGGIDYATGAASPTLERQQCNFITQEVIDATIQCMITQADECEKNGLPAYQTEKMVMEELGRCLVEIIDFSIRNTDNSYSQD